MHCENINNILSRTHAKKTFPKQFIYIYLFIYNKEVVTNTTVIANTFNTFYHYWPKSSQNIRNPLNKTFRHYMKAINSLKFEHVDEEIIYKTIDNMLPKARCGYDGIPINIVMSGHNVKLSITSW